MASKSRYSDWDIFQKEVQRLWNELGEFPSESKLSEMNREDLRHAFRLHKGWRKVRERMNAPKMEGKFSDFEIELRPVLEEIYQRCGRLSETFLREKGRHDLILAISKHGGMNCVKERLGLPAEKFERKKSPMRQWEYFKRQVEEWIETHGDFPELKELGEERRNDLILGFRFHGGANEVRKIMGFPPSGYSHGETTTPYKDFDELKKALDPLISEAGGKYPSRSIVQQKFKNLRYAIDMYHGGQRAVRLRLGLELTGKKPHPFDDKQTFLTALEAIAERLGSPPTWRDLIALKRHDLRYVLEEKKHGTWREIRIELGWTVRRTLGNLRDETVFKQKLAEAIEIIGHYPTSIELGKHGYSALRAAIQRHHGGINEFRESYGEKLTVIRKLKLSKEEFLKCLQQIRKELGRRPTKEEVIEMGGQYVGMAIRQKKFGTWEDVCNLLHWEPTYCTSPYRNVRTAKHAIKKITNSLGHFPKKRELKRMGFNTLYHAISNLHGGLYCFAEEMGRPHKKRKRTNPYRSYLKLSAELRDIYAGTRVELPLIYKLKRWDLLHGIIMNGGVGRVRRIMALQDEETANPVTGRPTLNELLSAMEKNSQAIESVLKKTENLVRGIAGKALTNSKRKYEAISIELDDLIQEGKLGILNGLSDYDPVLGSFSTHVVPWIKQHIDRSLIDKGYEIRVPVNKFDKWSELSKARAELFQLNDRRQPTLEELQLKTGWSYQKLNETLALGTLMTGTESLQETLYQDSEATREYFVSDGQSAEDVAVENSIEQLIKDEIARLLKPRDQRIMIDRLGLSGEVKTLEEIGKELGVTRERVRQLEERSRKKLAQSKVLQKLID